MNKKDRKAIDNFVQEMQINLVNLTINTAINGREIMQSQYINSINLINKYFKTNYLSYEILNMKFTDSENKVISGVISNLPLRKGDEKLYSKE